ncbi:hypothetical protein GDO81_028790 [Engystomops pustulosus]|uniref:Uncharacterized protein n=1 Tax=Engystomops pustulosus TaxID=76066 RepID=A0AAV6YNG4_ENGPU|nr:hypothetical protein GDO81_028790 [Engystomops pustulosus]
MLSGEGGPWLVSVADRGPAGLCITMSTLWVTVARSGVPGLLPREPLRASPAPEYSPALLRGLSGRRSMEPLRGGGTGRGPGGGSMFGRC